MLPENHSASSAPSTGRQLAAFVLESSWDSLPRAVRREGPRALVNWVGCALGGARTPIMDTAVAAMAQIASGSAAIIGRTETSDIAHSAMLNCIASTCHTFDDTHLGTITHPTGPVAAALLVIAGEQPVTGSDFMAAMLLGMEVECRISTALVGSGGTASGGWYITGVSGGIGAAAAVGRLLGLSPDQMASAIGLAALQAGGLRGAHASMAMAFVPGLAARAGVTAAKFAAAGFTCADAALTGPNGLMDVLAPGSAAAPILEGLGNEYEVLRNAYKPYPCGIVIHPAIDASLDIASRSETAEIAGVRLWVHPDAMRLTGRKFPHDRLQAQVSLFHWVAASLCFGRAGIHEGGDEAVQDKRVIALQHCIQATVDAAIQPDEAKMEVTLASGQVLTAHIPHATGSCANPMTDDDLAGKFMAQAAPTIGQERASALLEQLWATETTPNIAETFADS